MTLSNTKLTEFNALSNTMNDCEFITLSNTEETVNLLYFQTII